MATTYPDNPSTFLKLFSNGTGANGPAVWRLDWANDATSVEWTALPATGMLFPGETIKVIGWWYEGRKRGKEDGGR